MGRIKHGTLAARMASMAPTYVPLAPIMAPMTRTWVMIAMTTNTELGWGAMSVEGSVRSRQKSLHWRNVQRPG